MHASPWYVSFFCNKAKISCLIHCFIYRYGGKPFPRVLLHSSFVGFAARVGKPYAVKSPPEWDLIDPLLPNGQGVYLHVWVCMRAVCVRVHACACAGVCKCFSMCIRSKSIRTFPGNGIPWAGYNWPSITNGKRSLHDMIVILLTRACVYIYRKACVCAFVTFIMSALSCMFYVGMRVCWKILRQWE